MDPLNIIAAGAVLSVLGCLKDRGQKDAAARFPELEPVLDSLDDDALAELARLDELEPEEPYGMLIRLMAGEEAALFRPAQELLGLALACFYYPTFHDLLREGFHQEATVELAFQLAELPDAPLRAKRLLFEGARAFLDPVQEEAPFFHISLRADDRILGFLSGDRALDQALEPWVELFCADRPLTPLMIDEELCSQVSWALLHPDRAVILRGEKGRGRRFMLCHAMARAGMDVLIADAAALLAQPRELSHRLWLLQRESLLLNCWVCIHGLSRQLLEEVKLPVQDFVHRVAEPLLKKGSPLCFCTDMETELMPSLSVPVNQFSLPALARPEQIRLWEGYTALEGLELDCVELGTKYRFSPAEIRKACMQLKARGDGTPLEPRQTMEILTSILPPVLTKGCIEPFHPDCTLENLVLPDEIRAKIGEICASVRYSHQVYDQWNMESKFAYGKAVSVLLAGPPGTGKTMTARVLSDLLQLPLYHVNLSQVVDKYIGETEKHLEEIFTNAQRSNLILFFDEADAVFSKRSEVSDAKDKYANTEVSYILQRLESYDGIVLLASNFKGNIDPAFMRRMKYILKFQLPDEAERLALWKGCFPAECPTRNIDFDYLAQNFEFSGSSIKNAVLSAAFLAAQEGAEIGMRHLISGIKNEYRKQDKPIFSAEFGIYSGLC